ncbi:MAG: tetratricopeptide repeat protein, partial [Lachnospiraceae bacterium]|nr:tetratricopeptide repeat protein [Lachnospiraceae bacterium]
MDIQEALKGLDRLFQEYRIGEVEAYLKDKLKEAEAEGDMHAHITLLNEMIGYCRDTSQYDKAVHYCGLAQQAIAQQDLEGSVAHATTLLNIGNAYRAASLLKESMECYEKVFPIYDKHLDEKDFRYASLHNNLSLLYQEMGDYEHACD